MTNKATAAKRTTGKPTEKPEGTPDETAPDAGKAGSETPVMDAEKKAEELAARETRLNDFEAKLNERAGHIETAEGALAEREKAVAERETAVSTQEVSLRQEAERMREDLQALRNDIALDAPQFDQGGTDQPPAEGLTRVEISGPKKGRYRIGRHFGPGTVTLDLDDDQLTAVRADAKLSVKEV